MKVLVLLVAAATCGFTLMQSVSAEGCPVNCTCKGTSSFPRVECTQYSYVPNLPKTKHLILLNFSKQDFPRRSFINMSSLVRLEVKWSSLKELNNKSFEGLSRVRFIVLNLKGNKLKVIKAKSFEGLFNLLEKLDLSHNHISTIEFKAWLTLYRLKRLLLNNNNLTSIDKYIFFNLRSLTNVNFEHNKLTTLPTKLPLRWITMIDFSLNTLKEIKANMLMSSLVSIVYLTSNTISNIEIGTFEHNERIAYLYLDDNKLTNIDFLPSVYGKRLTKLKLSRNLIQDIGVGNFIKFTRLMHLYLDGNKISFLRQGAFEGLSELVFLYLENNQFKKVDYYSLNGLQKIAQLFLHNISMTRVPYLGNLTQIKTLKLSFNQLEFDPQNVIRNLAVMETLSLNNAGITVVPDLTTNSDLKYLFLSKNRIKTLSGKPFVYNPILKQLIINDNRIEILTNDSFTGAKSLEQINLSNNPLKQIAKGTFFLDSLKQVLLIDTMLKHPLLISTLSHPIVSFILLSSDLDTSGIITDDPYALNILPSSGYICKEIDVWWTKCLPCKLGTYISRSRTRCEDCPAGGFYQDEIAYTGVKSHGIGCKECPPGKYVSPERVPGRAETDCQSCPLGTELNKFAGFRACSCLEGHYRLNRFEGCFICTKGYSCVNETIDLVAGFFWIWSSKEIAEHYNNYKNDLQIRDMNYDPNLISFKGAIPLAHACPVAESCLGGIYSQCEAGYQGPLCAICAPGYFRFLSNCEKCPTIPWMIGQVILILVIFSFLLFVILRDKKDNKQSGRTLTDIILARLKIVISFFQVSSSTFDSLSYISWPGPLLVMMKYAKMIQLNLLQISPPSCITQSIHTNAYTHFLISIVFCVGVVLCCLAFLVSKRVQINHNKALSVSAKKNKILDAKTQCYRCMFLVLFITFPSICSQIFKILPESCHELCSYSNSQCRSYLRADYSIQCDNPTHRIYGNLSRAALMYTFFFPLFLFMILKRARDAQMKEKHDNSFPILNGTKFLYENYSPSCWYWEILELMRKILVSLLLILFEVESRMSLGVTAILSGLYTVAFALYKPIEDKFEYWLQMVSLLASSVNFTVGMLLKIPLEEKSSSISSQTDALLVTIVLMTANIVVIGLVAVTYISKIISTIIDLRKNPQCNLSCCLDVIQLANEAPGISDNVTHDLTEADTSQEGTLDANPEIQDFVVEEEEEEEAVMCIGNKGENGRKIYKNEQ